MTSHHMLTDGLSTSRTMASHHNKISINTLFIRNLIIRLHEKKT